MVVPDKYSLSVTYFDYLLKTDPAYLKRILQQQQRSYVLQKERLDAIDFSIKYIESIT